MANSKYEEKINRQGLKEFFLSSLAVDNGTSVILLAFMILGFGFLAYERMPKEQYPEASLPTIYINTPYPGNSAKDIENLVTRPIEKELQDIEGVKDILSTSIQDFSVITAEFEASEDKDDVLRKVKDAVDVANSELPEDLPQDPTILEVNFSELPIMSINLSGPFGMDQLRDLAEDLQDRIEDIKSVSKVDLKGALEREVQVDIDLLKMEAREVSFQDVENAIRSENLNMSGGELKQNDLRRAIRVVGEFENVSQMEEMIVKSENQAPIYLRDIATVKFDFKERTSIARSGKNPVISLDVIKRSGENLLSCSDQVKEVLERAEKNLLPRNMNVSIFNDLSINTRNEVNNLENSIISGVILVVLVLLFFMGLRNAMFVGIAIPLSMLMGILWLYISGVTLNIVVLFSLILALGMLVDNGIVVVENIFRYRQNGFEGKAASKYGTGEVAVPIIASTATTLAAFIPLAFWPGLMGEFMKYLPITLILVLSSSLFVALVINPVLTSRFMKVDERLETKEERTRKRNSILLVAGLAFLVAILGLISQTIWVRNLGVLVGSITLLNFFLLRPGAFFFQSRIMPWLERTYDKFVRFALRGYAPGLFFGGTFLLLFFAIGLLVVRSPKVEFFPSAEPLYVNVFVELPMGTDIEATNVIMQDLEERVSKAIEPYEGIVEEVLSQIGENTSDPNSPPEPGITPHKARLTVSFVKSQDRNGVSTFDVMNDIRDAVQGVPGVDIIVDKNADGPPTGKPINLELRGEDINFLVKTANDVISVFEESGIQGIEELQADVKLGKPELIINVDREAARRYEVSTFAIADAIRTSVYGKEVSKFKQGEDEYDIFVRLDTAYRYNTTQLLNQRITFRNPSNGRIVQVPISAVATMENSSTYNAVKRKNLDRVVTVFSNVVEGYYANEIVAELKTIMEDYPLPEGYSFEFTGEQQQQAEDMSFLATAFSVALFSIFLILVAQFNSISQPFLIILSVLFSTIGVFLGYTFTGKTISVIFTGVGVISLAGVVVNNAIVLIDYINLLRRRRAEEKGIEESELPSEEVREAIILGGATRLRPVLLTAITTILGLVPLAIGFNMNFFTLISKSDPQIFIGGDNTAIWGPMAWTVIYGLIFATFLTLVVIPVMYWLNYRLQMAVKRLFSPRRRRSEMDLELAE